MISINSKVTPKASLSQNFLATNGKLDKIITRISSVLDEDPDMGILEIGPGTGVLTRHLINFQRKFLAIEIDRDLIEKLNLEFGEKTNFRLTQGDGLELISQKAEILNFSERWILASNLPFHVGSRILVELGLKYPQMDFAVILQKEVILKTVSKTNMTFFGLWINLFWEIQTTIWLPAGNFFPRPKVACGFFIGKSKLKTKKLPKFLETTVENEDKLNKFLIICQSLFKFPRKSIYNNLQTIWTKSQVESFFSKENLDPKLRLNWENYELIIAKICQFSEI